MSLEFNVRFPDGKFYLMSPSYKKKGVLPLNKNGVLANRCNKGDRKCKAKTKQNYKKDTAHLMHIEKHRDDIISVQNWEILHGDIVHTCGKPCKLNYIEL